MWKMAETECKQEYGFGLRQWTPVNDFAGCDQTCAVTELFRVTVLSRFIEKEKCSLVIHFRFLQDFPTSCWNRYLHTSYVIASSCQAKVVQAIAIRGTRRFDTFQQVSPLQKYRTSLECERLDWVPLDRTSTNVRNSSPFLELKLNSKWCFKPQLRIAQSAGKEDAKPFY